MPDDRILVTGAAGQLGSVLTAALRRDFGGDAVIAVDIHKPENPAALGKGPFECLDILSREDIRRVIESGNIGTVYHLAAIKSYEAEKRRAAAWNVNVNGLYNVLDVLRERKGSLLLFPSSIAAFGPNGGDPQSLYGVSKRAGELLCGFFHHGLGLDARSLRLPGVISPDFPIGGGGLTDFATEIFREAVGRKRYVSYIEEGTEVELIHVVDALAAMRALANAPPEKINYSAAYTIRAFAASPGLLSKIIHERIPGFELVSEIDPIREAIASNLPTKMDDSAARKDWGYNPAYTLERAASEMLDRALA